MSIYEEPPFRFDFSAATHSVKHDKPSPDDWNSFWPGVDFRVLESNREVWIEVKSWKRKTLRDRTERIRIQSDFDAKFVNKQVAEFRDDIVAKFLGTTCYLAWSQIGVPDRVYYVVLLEPPNRGSNPFLLTFARHLRDGFKEAQARSWGRRIQYKVVNLAEFQREFPNYPVVWL